VSAAGTAQVGSGAVTGPHWVELGIFSFFFLTIAILGFVAARWRRADLDTLEEWGVGGRTFGTILTWFLVGGDIYTAYTFIAVPALVFGKGALGLFALPYTVVVYPLMFLVLPRLWQVAHNHRYVTAADFVTHRFESRTLGLLVAVTGIVATMPYIALQMYGIEVVIGYMGVSPELALTAAFVILAAFTYVSGLRAPALISLVKDVIIFITVLGAVIYIPARLGGYRSILHAVPMDKLILPADQSAAYSTLFLGSALALFLYPHAMTSIFSSKSQHAVKRNMALLPAYTFVLGLMALLGYMAIAAGIQQGGPYGANGVVPQLFERMFPHWFTGFAFAAIGIGALVPASVMSIAAANLFGRNIYTEYIRPHADHAHETFVTKVASLVVKGGALAFILVVPAQFVINFQLAGGVWILQTLPAVFMAAFFTWLDRRAILLGWIVGIAWGTWMLWQEGFNSALHALPWLGIHTKIYIAVSAFAANLLVVVVGSVLARASGGVRGRGPLREEDYEVPTAA